jgi:hypothetical protein
MATVHLPPEAVWVTYCGLDLAGRGVWLARLTWTGQDSGGDGKKREWALTECVKGADNVALGRKRVVLLEEGPLLVEAVHVGGGVGCCPLFVVG